MRTKLPIIMAGTLAGIALLAVPALSHHSFAMYDQSKTVVLTGAMKQFISQANHAELSFYLIQPDRKGIEKGPDGKPVEWGVEMAGAAAVAQQGITVQTFKAGTVFSVKLNPLRDGKNFGSRTGALRRVSGRSGDKQTQTAGPGQALRFNPGRHTVRRNHLLENLRGLRGFNPCNPRNPNIQANAPSCHHVRPVKTSLKLLSPKKCL
jgi:hypothetical protein